VKSMAAGVRTCRRPGWHAGNTDLWSYLDRMDSGHPGATPTWPRALQLRTSSPTGGGRQRPPSGKPGPSSESKRRVQEPWPSRGCTPRRVVLPTCRTRAAVDPGGPHLHPAARRPSAAGCGQAELGQTPQLFAGGQVPRRPQPTKKKEEEFSRPPPGMIESCRRRAGLSSESPSTHYSITRTAPDPVVLPTAEDLGESRPVGEPAARSCRRTTSLIRGEARANVQHGRTRPGQPRFRRSHFHAAQPACPSPDPVTQRR